MKRILLLLLFISGFCGAIYFCFFNYSEQGTVIGKINVSKPYGDYNHVDISFTYEDKNGYKHDVIWKMEDKYYLENTERGRHLQEGKYYEVSLLSELSGVFLVIVFTILVIILIVQWSCFSDDFDQDISKDKFLRYCDNCTVKHFCYLANSNISDNTKNKVKQFFGY